MANGLLAKNGIIVTGSIEVQNAVTASAFSGDGSGLVGIAPFPYTGSAAISGSLEVTGSIGVLGPISTSQIQLGTATIYSGSTRTSIGVGRTPYYYAGNNAVTADGFYSYNGGSAASPALYLGSNGGGAGRGIYGVNQGIAFSANNSTIAYIRGRTNDSSGNDSPRIGIGVDPSAHIDLAAHINSTRNLLRISGSSAATHAEAFFISSSGNTGIGTWSPNYKLEVVGDISASTYYGDGSNLTNLSIPSTHLNTTAFDTETLSSNFNYASSLNIAQFPSSVESVIMDYRLTNLNSGSRAGTFIYTHNGTDLNYVDSTVEGVGNGNNPILSATLTGSIVSIDIENAAGFNFSGFAKKFNKLDASVAIANPNVNYLLDTYSGASAAYSLRQLSQLYIGSAIRVREDGTNTETDIGFDVNGNLDTAAIVAHCGSSNGYVTIWYDQSGNGNNAEQTTAGNQPQIYDGYDVITENGNPAIITDGAGDHFILNSGLGNLSLYTVFCVLEGGVRNPSSGEGSMLFAQGASDWLWYFNANTGTIQVNSTGTAKNISSTWQVSQRVDFHSLVSNTAYFGSNGATLTSVSSVTGGIPINYILGHYSTNGNYNYKGKSQEIIIWESDQSSNRNDIESNINNYYSIYGTGLLTNHPGAAAAYSVRQLTSTYSGNIINIRRSSDNTEQAIGLIANGDLDTNAIETFCSGTECYVTIWYDQSGNNNHASQTTQAEQPKIFELGSIITSSAALTPSIKFGKPGWPPSTTLDLSNSIGWYDGTGVTFFIVNRSNTDAQPNRLIGNRLGQNVYLNQGSNNLATIRASNTTYNYSITSSIGINNDDLLQVLTYSSASRSGSLYINDFNIEVLTGSEEFSPSYGIDRIGEGQGNQQYNYYGHMSELIIYTSSVDINNVRNNINNHFNIY